MKGNYKIVYRILSNQKLSCNLSPQNNNSGKNRAPTFRLESKVTQLAHIRPDISMSADVFFEHAWLLTADSTLFTNVLSTSTSSDIHVIFIWFVPIWRRGNPLWFLNTLNMWYIKPKANHCLTLIFMRVFPNYSSWLLRTLGRFITVNKILF